MSINFLLIFFVLIVVAMIAFILVQKGTGATAGSAFGSGASSTVFGAKGSGNFLTKTTMILAFLFFAISMLMAVSANREFTAAATGEVDLGVIGTLDTNADSDVPEMIGTDDNVDQTGDVPVLNEQAPTEVNQGATSTTEKTNSNKDLSDMKDKIEQKVNEVKSEVEDAQSKVDELKGSLEDGVKEAKETIDGEG